MAFEEVTRRASIHLGPERQFVSQSLYLPPCLLMTALSESKSQRTDIQEVFSLPTSAKLFWKALL
jgi:hypothetical protein